eukprot:4560572-Amphidinium_carterae.1
MEVRIFLLPLSSRANGNKVGLTPESAALHAHCCTQGLLLVLTKLKLHLLEGLSARRLHP